MRKPSISIREKAGEQTGRAITTLLQECILAWSYPEKVTPENIADLDDETAIAVVAVLNERAEEADQKNSPGRSTTP